MSYILRRNDEAIEVNVLENLETIINTWSFNAKDLNNFKGMKYNKIDFLIRNNILDFSSLNFNVLNSMSQPKLFVLFFEVGFQRRF